METKQAWWLCFFSMFIPILPTRHGNLFSATSTASIIWYNSDPTYEAWKLDYIYTGKQPKFQFRSYLRGMETVPPDHLWNQMELFRSYLRGMETTHIDLKGSKEFWIPILPTRHGNLDQMTFHATPVDIPILPTRHGNSMIIRRAGRIHLVIPILPTRHGNQVGRIELV